ncbi:MAG: 3-oxoadipate enol-lactonase [Solirubrobacteraceae bacterium]
MSVAELYHEQSGPDDAPALLLGSSLGTTLEMWGPALATPAGRALAGRYRIVRFDHRGHGRSPVPDGPYEIADLGRDVLAMLDRLDLERVSYAGVSLAGMVGLWLAAHAPERIEALVCICSSAHLPPPQAWAERAASVRAAESVAAVADRVLERWFTPTYARSHPEVIEWVGATLRSSPPEGYAACCGAIERLDLRRELALIKAPTLAVGAAEDSAIPPAHSKAIAAAVAGARLEVLPHGAHLAAIECADEVAASIERYLEEPA